MMGGREWALLAVLAILWGSSFMMAEIALRHIPPFTLVLMRVSAAATLLCLTLRGRGTNLNFIWRRRRCYIVMALLGSALPFAGFSWGQQYIDSSLAGMLNSTTPLFAIVFAWMTAEEPVRWRRLAGLVLGAIGVGILLNPSADDTDMMIWGSLAALAASASYAVMAIYARRRATAFAPMENACGQLTWSAILLLPVSFIVEAPWQLSWLPAQAVVAAMGMAFFSTYCAFLLYFYLLRKIGAVNVTQVAFMIPLVAVVLGAGLLGESLGMIFFVGAGLVLLGLLVANRRAKT